MIYTQFLGVIKFLRDFMGFLYPLYMFEFTWHWMWMTGPLSLIVILSLLWSHCWWLNPIIVPFISDRYPMFSHILLVISCDIYTSKSCIYIYMYTLCIIMYIYICIMYTYIYIHIMYVYMYLYIMYIYILCMYIYIYTLCMYIYIHIMYIYFIQYIYNIIYNV